MKILLLMKISKETITLLLSLSYIEIKVLIYFVYLKEQETKTDNIIYLSPEKRKNMAEELKINTQRISTALKKLKKKLFIEQVDLRKYKINNLFLSSSYNEAIQEIYNEKYFKQDECNI